MPWMVASATITSVLGFTGMSLWRGGLFPIAVAAVAVGIGVGLSFPIIIRAAIGRVAPPLHGYSIGLLNTGIFLGVFLSPFIFGPLRRSLGTADMFVICAGIWLICGTVAAFRLPSAQRAALQAT